ncbi:MAG: hypothetical protein H6718_19205 [Polyangiaceae bacterium]|nr:hypothetical protein [Myxococcales bacterium]MCB9587538.1 hypothetical protein [Polyangiaceae bacterium]MCB9605665.1 hypothetical protein [Polyangiaceae bacterium]
MDSTELPGSHPEASDKTIVDPEPPSGRMAQRDADGRTHLNRFPGDPAPHDRIKGVAIAAFVQWYQQTQDRARLAEVIASMRPEHRVHLDVNRPGAGLIASTWYPSALVHELLDGLSAGLSESETEALATQAEGAVMDATLHGVHKLFFRMLVTPERYARYSQPLWNRFFDSGQMVTEVEGNEVRSRATNWRGYHCFICRMNREAMRIIHTAMGVKVLGKVETVECMAQGDKSCSNRLRMAR